VSATIRTIRLPPGWRIDSIVGSFGKFSALRIDTDHNDDRQGGGPSGPVKEFKFRGDRDGDDAGSYTGDGCDFQSTGGEIGRGG
jgi:hypothetical protein